MTLGQEQNGDFCERDVRRRSHISLFTGAGGLDLGIEQAGFTTLVAVEKDKHARATLCANRQLFKYPEFEVFDNAVEVSGEDLLTAAGVGRGELDLLTGGAPCQSFSTAGRRGAARVLNGTLVGRFLDLVGEIQPRFFVLENVRGILSAAVRHRPLSERGPEYPPLDSDEELGSFLNSMVLPRIIGEDQLGYQLSYGLLNSADFGVPQVRQRAIFIGSRDYELGGAGNPSGIERLVLPTHYEGQDGGLPTWRDLEDAFEDFPVHETEGAQYSQARREVLERVPAGRNWRYLRDEYGEGYLRAVMGGAYNSSGGKVGFWRRLSFDRPSPTLPASPVQKATSLCHPEDTRPLNVREYARVQQFPDEYRLVGPTASKYVQIGNAVPVGLARAIGTAIVQLDHAGHWCQADIYGNSSIRPAQARVPSLLANP